MKVLHAAAEVFPLIKTGGLADVLGALPQALIAEGADVIDIGAESTRPYGAQPISAEEELQRLQPVLGELIASAATGGEVPDRFRLATHAGLAS